VSEPLKRSVWRSQINFTELSDEKTYSLLNRALLNMLGVLAIDGSGE